MQQSKTSSIETHESRAVYYCSETCSSLIMSIYIDNGFANRNDYLNSLREEYGEAVDLLISILPASEDFDGLITSLEDFDLETF